MIRTHIRIAHIASIHTRSPVDSRQCDLSIKQYAFSESDAQRPDSSRYLNRNDQPINLVVNIGDLDQSCLTIHPMRCDHCHCILIHSDLIFSKAWLLQAPGEAKPC